MVFGKPTFNPHKDGLDRKSKFLWLSQAFFLAEDRAKDTMQQCLTENKTAITARNLLNIMLGARLTMYRMVNTSCMNINNLKNEENRNSIYCCSRINSFTRYT